MDIKQLGKELDIPILSESSAGDLEKRKPFHSAYTPLHGLFAKFVHTSCFEHCFSKAEYYHCRCISALCFARWLVLNGYANFTDEELEQSLAEERKEK